MSPAPDRERERRILSLWESAVGRPRPQRDEALLGETDGPRALGARNRLWLAIRIALFGRDWPLRSDCPACAGPCEFAVDAVALAENLDDLPPARDSATIEWQGRTLELHAPTADDLFDLSGADDLVGAARMLMARCAASETVAGLAEDELTRLGREIESLDPAAVISFALACPDCGHLWPAPVDVAEALWTEVRDAAERSLTEVDALARAYGWDEEQVMSLSPVRRAAYLQLVAA
jgi:hypothetical protein